MKTLVLTSVMSLKVCRPELSSMVLMATGIFTVSPSGVQHPYTPFQTSVHLEGLYKVVDVVVLLYQLSYAILFSH